MRLHEKSVTANVQISDQAELYDIKVHVVLYNQTPAGEKKGEKTRDCCLAKNIIMFPP